MTHILLLEDDPILGKNLKLSLELEGFQVSWAQDIQTAEKIETESSFDLFVLDWNLPDGSGTDFCARIRKKNTLVPILFLTARTDEDSAVKALTLGANDFIRKPFGQAEFFARIRANLKDTHVREEQIRFGDLLVLVSQRRALWNKEPIELNRREFDVLAFLAKKADTVVTREELLAVIDKEGLLFDRTIDSHLSHLRGRLRKAGISQLQIASIYGVGYRLEMTPSDKDESKA